MKIVQINNISQPLPAPLRVGYCNSFACRLRGLMFRSKLEHADGLLLVEGRDSRIDSSIHMLFVKMDLGIIWINSKKTVVDTLLARAWHLAYAPHEAARFTLEIHPDRLSEFKMGDLLEF